MKTYLSLDDKNLIRNIMFEKSHCDNHSEYTNMGLYLAKKFHISIKRLYMILDYKD